MTTWRCSTSSPAWARCSCRRVRIRSRREARRGSVWGRTPRAPITPCGAGAGGRIPRALIPFQQPPPPPAWRRRGALRMGRGAARPPIAQRGPEHFDPPRPPAARPRRGPSAWGPRQPGLHAHGPPPLSTSCGPFLHLPFFPVLPTPCLSAAPQEKPNKRSHTRQWNCPTAHPRPASFTGVAAGDAAPPARGSPFGALPCV
jgi:hypothetical protein